LARGNGYFVIKIVSVLQTCTLFFLVFFFDKNRRENRKVLKRSDFLIKNLIVLLGEKIFFFVN